MQTEVAVVGIEETRPLPIGDEHELEQSMLGAGFLSAMVSIKPKRTHPKQTLPRLQT